MPSWKKVIISGSAAELSSLIAASITGSLQGTASFALTASYAATASVSLSSTSNQLLGINKSGFTITKGTVVHLTGSTNSSDTPYITTASYESDNLSANTLGIAAETITFNSTGYITTEGVLTGLNVTGLVAGQVVYLGAGGTITGSAPIAPLHSVRLGQVVRDSPTNNGSIYVRIDNGYEIGELHDVIDSTTNASYGDLLVKSGSVWTTGNQLTGSYGVTGSFSVQAPGASGIVLDTSINSDTQSSRLFFKNSSSYTDFSIRNIGQLLVIAASASAGVSSGTGRMYISASGEVAIGTGYNISAGRGAALQVSGSINIEEGFAYKQDGRNVIYITPGTNPVTTAFNNTIAGELAASGTAYFDQMTAFGYQALYQSSGSDLTAVGYAAGSGYSGSSATLIGWGAGLQAKASNQTAVGESAGAYNTGSSQSAYGYQAGYLNTGSNQTAIGNSAGWKNTATQQTAVGLQAGYLNIGIAQTALGQQAGQSNSGSTQTAVGYAAGFQNSGSTQVAIGAQAGRDNIGAAQTVTGYEAGRLNTADYQTATGYQAGYQNTGSYQTAYGYRSGFFTTASTQTAIGGFAGRAGVSSAQTAVGFTAGEFHTGSNQTAIGAYAGRFVTASNQTAVGYAAGEYNIGENQIAIGYAAGQYNIGQYQTALGVQAGYQNSGSNQTAMGVLAGYQNSGSNQTATGYAAGQYNIARDQTAIGVAAGRYNTGSAQTAVGYGAGIGNSGSSVTQVGYGAGQYNIGQYQTALGAQAGYANSGSDQTAVGYFAGAYNSGSDNTNIGYTAGYYIAGTGGTINSQSAQSVFLGSQTTAGGANRTNQIVIGYDAQGIGSNSVVLGNSSIQTTALRGFVGIGITTPTASLHINNTTTTSASLLVEDSANPDATPFIIDYAGNVGIGTTTPTAKLYVSGNAGAVNWVGTDHIYQQFYPSGFGAGRFGYIGYPSSGSTQLSIVNEFVGGNLEFRTSGSAGINRLFMSASGNVGIGTSTPTTKLDVNGNTIISGSLTTTSSVAFKAYTSATSFPGTAAGYLAFDSAGNILTTAGVAAGAAGSNTQIQYNNAGALAGTSAITFDGTTLRATGSFTGSLVGALTGTASFAVSASRAITASFALTASYATIKTSGTTIYSADPAAGPSFNTVGGIFLGAGAAAFATNAQYSNFIGNDAGITATNASYSNIIGYQSGYIATNAQYSNIIGYQAGNAAENASYSNLIGFRAGQKVGTNNIGSNNIIIGTNLTLPNGTVNAINIGGIIFGTGSNTYTGSDPISSSMANGRIGICVTNPQATLDVSGSFNVSGSYVSPSGNTIDSNALLQAGLLYLSNNF